MLGGKIRLIKEAATVFCVLHFFVLSFFFFFKIKTAAISTPFAILVQRLIKHGETKLAVYIFPLRK
jgi:hypothetical protein